MDAVKLQNFRSFLDRLSEAQRQQTKNLEAARAEYEKRRALWSENASRRNPWAAPSNGFARKSKPLPTVTSSAKATMRPCASPWRAASRAERPATAKIW